MTVTRRVVLTFGAFCFLVVCSLGIDTTVTAQDPKDGQDATAKRLEAIEQKLAKIDRALADLAGRDGPAERVRLQPFKQDKAIFPLPATFPKRALSSARGQGGVGAGDRDRDGLTDVEEGQLGTSPDNPDTDGDGLLDGWEVHGVNEVDLRALGASPLRKDIFVEMDYMERDTATNGLGPNAEVLRGIEEAFRNAPVANPDGTTGISIHLETGNKVPYDDDLSPYMTAFAALKRDHFDARRAPAFHYMIWANAYGGGTSSGVSMNIPHSDFLVTLGRWNNQRGGTTAQKIGTFIHELGHNLGLMHGGSEHVGYKPNHLSVMNYAFQTRGILRGGRHVFDYQRFPLPALDESALRERDGLGGSAALQDYSTIFYYAADQAAEVPCAGAIDWDRSGGIDTAATVAVDVNNDTLLTNLRATPNEWASVIYTGGSIGSQVIPSEAVADATARYQRLPVVQLTEEMDQKIEAMLKRSRERGALERRHPPLAELDEAKAAQLDRALGPKKAADAELTGYTHELAKDESYYTSYTQGAPPDGMLKAKSRVRLVALKGAVARVVIAGEMNPTDLVALGAGRDYTHTAKEGAQYFRSLVQGSGSDGVFKVVSKVRVTAGGSNPARITFEVDMPAERLTPIGGKDQRK